MAAALTEIPDKLTVVRNQEPGSGRLKKNVITSLNEKKTI